MSDFLELYFYARHHKSRLIHGGGMQTANSKSKAICLEDGDRTHSTQSSVMSPVPPIYIYLHLAHSASLRTGSEEGNGVRREHKYSFDTQKLLKEKTGGTPETSALFLKKQGGRIDRESRINPKQSPEGLSFMLTVSFKQILTVFFFNNTYIYTFFLHLVSFSHFVFCNFCF